MKNEFNDLFSNHSTDYAKFRPTYPKDLFIYLACLCEERTLAWDCGTGNGQAAVALSSHFSTVIATDPSEKQISLAPPLHKVEYFVGSAESSHLTKHSVDLITVAQALHWFQLESFFNEAARVLKPKGILAFWCYQLAEVNAEIDAVVLKLYQDVLGTYWEKERRLVDEAYKNVVVPFKELDVPQIVMSVEWSLAHFVGYLSTWSAVQTYIRKNSKNPIENVFSELKQLWEKDQKKKVHWNLGLRVFINK